MCLAIPGKVVEITDSTEWRMARIDYDGIRKEASLAFTPEAAVGDYVLVHAGFAISRIDEAQAQEVFAFLRQTGEDVDAELNPVG